MHKTQCEPRWRRFPLLKLLSGLVFAFIFFRAFRNLILESRELLLCQEKRRRRERKILFLFEEHWCVFWCFNSSIIIAELFHFERKIILCVAHCVSSTREYTASFMVKICFVKRPFHLHPYQISLTRATNWLVSREMTVRGLFTTVAEIISLKSFWLKREKTLSSKHISLSFKLGLRVLKMWQTQNLWQTAVNFLQNQFSSVCRNFRFELHIQTCLKPLDLKLNFQTNCCCTSSTWRWRFYNLH